MPTQEVARPVRLSALLRRGGPRPHRVLFDGGGADSWGDGMARYSDSPSATLTAWPSGWSCHRQGGVEHWRWGDPWAQWQAFVADARHRGGEGGGVASALSYDLKHSVERLTRRLPWPTTPLLFAARYDWSLRVDHRGSGAHLVAGDTAQLDAARRWYERPDPAPCNGAPPARRPRPAIAKDHYLAMLARAREYIAAGDIYQVNLAVPFHAAVRQADAPALVAAWSEQYPMPYAAYLDGGAWTLVSNSPECLLQLAGDRIATYPIKGTRGLATTDRAAAPGGASERPGGWSPARADLVADPKERAEHVMIVDLERNDLGRICAIGSVAVADLFAARDYPLLTHMESAVRGRLRPGTGLADVLRAIFPGGSITGAPKIRAMQIIEELDPAARGFYTGAIGWSDADGRTTFNISIRTAVLDADGLCYWAGGGIVADSDPEREYAETKLKTEALVRALATMERDAR